MKNLLVYHCNNSICGNEISIENLFILDNISDENIDSTITCPICKDVMTIQKHYNISSFIYD